MNVVLYARVSSEDQAEKDLSIPAQRKELRAICARDGHRVVAEFADEGVSAYGPAEKRKEFMAMLDYCVSHPLDAVLVVRFDRFSRNQKESIIYKGVLRRKGVRVISISEPIDTSTPAGELHEGMIELINQYYSRLLSVMVRKGMKEAIDQGFWPGKAPLGYKLEPVGEHSRLVIGDEKEVALIREIFRLAYEEKKGSLLIGNALAERGIRPVRARAWRSSVIYTILTNPVYKGTLMWGTVTKNEGRRTKQTDPDKIITIPDYVPALVEPAVWDAVQAAIKRRPFKRPRENREGLTATLLGRLLRCGCGGTYAGHRQVYYVKGGTEPRYYGYYRCNYRTYDGRQFCKSRCLPIDLTEETVVRMVRSQMTPAVLDEAERTILERWEEQKRAVLSPAKLEEQLADIDQQIQRYYQAIGAGLDPLVCKGLIAELEDKKVALRKKAELLRAQADTRRFAEEQLKEARRLVHILTTDFDTLSIEGKRDVLLPLIERVEVLEEGELLNVVLTVPVADGTERSIKSGGPARSRRAARSGAGFLLDAAEGDGALQECGD